jgi:hypothetical protein
MAIISLAEAIELGKKIRIKSGILRISKGIPIDMSTEQKVKLLDDIGRLEIQPLFIINKVKICNANVANRTRIPTLSVDFESFPETRGCNPHAWFNIKLSEKNKKRWHAPAKGAFMDLFKMIGIRCTPSKAPEYIGKLKGYIYTAEYHPDYDKKDKIVNSSILLANISYEQIIRANELRNSSEIFASTLRNSSEIVTKKSSETYMPAKQLVHGLQEDSGACTTNYENKCTREHEASNTCRSNPYEQTTEEWLKAYSD